MEAVVCGERGAEGLPYITITTFFYLGNYSVDVYALLCSCFLAELSEVRNLVVEAAAATGRSPSNSGKRPEEEAGEIAASSFFLGRVRSSVWEKKSMSSGRCGSRLVVLLKLIYDIFFDTCAS